MCTQNSKWKPKGNCCGNLSTGKREFMTRNRKLTVRPRPPLRKRALLHHDYGRECYNSVGRHTPAPTPLRARHQAVRVTQSQHMTSGRSKACLLVLRSLLFHRGTKSLGFARHKLDFLMIYTTSLLNARFSLV